MHAKQTSDQISIFLQAVQPTTDTMIFSTFLGLPPFVHAHFNQRLPHFELIINLTSGRFMFDQVFVPTVDSILTLRMSIVIVQSITLKWISCRKQIF